MTAYYNEIEPSAVAWLRDLIKRGLIADGIVDDRSIEDVQPDDLKGFTQCHWFGGIGGWSLALRMAGWADDRPVWTGSCPCQDFSSAGKQEGFDGTRHLWPAFYRLITERRPDVILGEQVASPLALAWLDLVRDDLEDSGYACGAVDLAAASVGAPNIRQRLYWVADSGGVQRASWRAGNSHADGSEQLTGRGHVHDRVGSSSSSSTGLPVRQCPAMERTGRWEEGRATVQPGEALADPDGLAHHHHRRQSGCEGSQTVGYRHPLDADGGTFWTTDGDDLQWIPCRDGKWRPAQSGIPPLASGVPNRVALIRGAGNSINPYVAAEFIRAYLDVI